MSSSSTLFETYSGPTRKVLLVTDCQSSKALYTSLLRQTCQVTHDKNETAKTVFAKIKEGGIDMVLVTPGNSTMDTMGLIFAFKENVDTANFPLAFVGKPTIGKPILDPDQEMERINRLLPVPVRHIPSPVLVDTIMEMMGWT